MLSFLACQMSELLLPSSAALTANYNARMCCFVYRVLLATLVSDCRKVNEGYPSK